MARESAYMQLVFEKKKNSGKFVYEVIEVKLDQQGGSCVVFIECGAEATQNHFYNRP